MIKYLKQQGYQHKADYNDLTDRQFSLVSASMTDSESSTLGNSILDREETYSLFVKDVDLARLQSDVVDILNTAISEGINVSAGTVVDVENVENGYIITLVFTIRG